MLKLALPVMMLCLATCVYAQDIHYVQTTNSPLNISPALTGVFRGDYRFASSYRQQWTGVPVKYQQFTGAFDMPLAKAAEQIEPKWSAGALFNYDRAGDGSLSLTALALNASYTQRLHKRHFAVIGASLGFIQRSFDPNGLYFDDQYDGDTNTKPTGENFAKTNVLMPDFSAGINWAYQHKNKRTAFNTGLAMYHINRPDKAFSNALMMQYDQRVTAHSTGTIKLLPNQDLLINLLGQWQGPHQEYLLGVGTRVHLNQTKTKELAVNANLSWRPNDAIIPQVGLFYKNWQVDLSYDINTSAFQRATNNRGGPEISLIYVITKVPPLDYCPLCPTYL